MTQSGPSQGQPASFDQERIWDAGQADAEDPEATVAESDTRASDAPRPARLARPGGTASTWSNSLTSTAAMPGPAGRTLADVPNRVLALVLDMIVLAVAGLVLALVVGGFFGGMTSGGQTVGGSLDDAGRGVNVAAFLVVAVAQLALSFGYFAYAWVVLRWTAGMMLMGLQIGNQGDGHPISWNQGVIRWLLLGIPATLATFAVYVPSLLGLALGLLGVAWLLGLLYTMTQDPSKQGLQDRRAHTIIVRARRRST